MNVLRKAVVYELRLWRSLFRWILRRPMAPAGADVYRYAQVLTPVFLAFIGLSAVELPVLHLLLPWETARRVCDAIGAYGLFWMIGLLATMRVHPHVLGEEGLRVRQGSTVDVTIPWEIVASVRSRHRSLERKKAVQYQETDAGLVASVVILSQTNVDVVLRGPTAVALPGASGPVTELRLYADDPGALATRAKERLAARALTP